MGISISEFFPASSGDPINLANPDGGRLKATEQAIDDVRKRFGDDAIKKGRGLRTSKLIGTSRTMKS